MRLTLPRPALWLLLSACSAATLVGQSPTHPLDGLSAREHWAIYDALIASGKTDTTTRYLYVGLQEPPKPEVLGWARGRPFRCRRALWRRGSASRPYPGSPGRQ